jgi:nucleoside phosphorylase
MIAVVGRLKEEIGELRERMVIRRTLPWRSARFYEGWFDGGSVLLAQTGMGRERAVAAVRYLLDIFPVRAIISVGFCGALQMHLRCADVVIVTQTEGLPLEEERAPGRKAPGRKAPGGVAPGRACHSDDGLIAMAEEGLKASRVRYHLGRGVTAYGLIANPKEKKALGEDYGAEIVDMESHWIDSSGEPW